nr:hypothetical protein [Tanacetum cinerariifolium]
GLRGSKKLKPDALSLYVGDGHRVAVEAIETYHLELPSGLVIVLNNCHYAHSITRGVISVSCLFDDGFINCFDENNVILVSKKNLVYFMAVPRDGIFEIDMSCLNTNDNSMYVISNKRAKINLDSSLLWHCRLGHISKKRIEKLQHDRLLNSIHIESFLKCVFCMSGKMARKPYSHQVERAKDLLGLIDTDVCGPFRIVSRQGANYFVTFTNDFSRYGYVYLLKHKHEVFETFKKWLDAMNVEIQSMKDNDVCILVELPPNARTIARLVAKGFTQTYEVDYKETSSPVADIRAIRILIAIVAYYDYEIWQMDVKTAFLNGHLSEEVYMEQPEGDAAYILGIKIYRDRSKRLIGLCQSAYIEKILKIYYMENSKHRTTPMQEKLKLSKSQGASTPAEKQRMQNIPYASAIGSIMYDVKCTRPDVAFAQNITSRFQQNPGEEHWTAVKNILKYLCNTKDMFLVYGGNMERELRVCCYTDAGYLTDADDLKT